MGASCSPARPSFLLACRVAFSHSCQAHHEDEEYATLCRPCLNAAVLWDQAIQRSSMLPIVKTGPCLHQPTIPTPTHSLIHSCRPPYNLQQAPMKLAVLACLAVLPAFSSGTSSKQRDPFGGPG